MVMFFSGFVGLTLGAVAGLGLVFASFAFLFLLLEWGGVLSGSGAPGALAELGGLSPFQEL
jgi:hypothetical protein